MLLEIESQEIWGYGEQQSLQSGTLLETDIVQDKRRLYEWVLDPFILLQEHCIDLSGVVMRELDQYEVAHVSGGQCVSGNEGTVSVAGLMGASAAIIGPHGAIVGSVMNSMAGYLGGTDPGKCREVKGNGGLVATEFAFEDEE